MTPEQKAKAYNEAIKRAKAMIKVAENDEEVYKSVITIFPELAESEDEIIRKALINGFKDYKFWDEEWFDGVTVREAIAWLEKQGNANPYSGVSFKYNGHTWGMCARDNGVEIIFDGELKAFLSSEKSFIYPNHPQPDLAPKSTMEEKVDNQNCVESADKVEPKFQNGKWIVWQNKCYKVNYNGCGYELIDQNGLRISLEYGTIDASAHLWDITEDAKPGDILFQDLMGGLTFIFDGVNPEMAILYSFIISNDGGVVAHYNIGKPNTGIGYVEEKKNIIHPATEEQRNLLFQKMKEAGYTFDLEKKELKKIVDEEQIKKNLQDNSFRRMFEKKPAEWSEEDEYTLGETIQHLEELIRIDKAKHCACDVQYYQRDIEWLKSLKDRVQPQNTWKPSDDQMEALDDALGLAKSCGKEEAFDLRTLYEQLQKIKENKL